MYKKLYFSNIYIFHIVAPLIFVRNQNVAATVNYSTSFECEVEAFPHAVHYWERAGKVLDNDDKYILSRINVPNYDYKFIMKLNISSVTDSDNGTYFCVSKNEEGIVAGNITLHSKYLK